MTGEIVTALKKFHKQLNQNNFQSMYDLLCRINTLGKKEIVALYEAFELYGDQNDISFADRYPIRRMLANRMAAIVLEDYNPRIAWQLMNTFRAVAQGVFVDALAPLCDPFGTKFADILNGKRSAL